MGLKLIPACMGLESNTNDDEALKLGSLTKEREDIENRKGPRKMKISMDRRK